MSAAEQVVKSVKSCWSCKRRKTGCDKALPSCYNCVRSHRICEGYGLKLSWPDDGDGRRPESIPCRRSSDTKHFLSRWGGPFYFLNTSDEDLLEDIKRPLPIPAITRWHSLPPNMFSADPSVSLNFGYETTLRAQESLLLSYYTVVLSRMVTTIDDSKNGFRTVILPVALSEANDASSGLCQAVFAISAYHLWGHDAAVKYKLSAIVHLSKSLQNGEDAALPQFATSMMLCIGDVFDSADGSWPKHLAAAKAFGNQLSKSGDYSKDLLFLQTLLEYHDVLKDFSLGRHLASDSKSTSTLEAITIPEESSDDTVIIGSLGCSRELMKLIALITRLRSLIPLPQSLQALPILIQTRLEDLTQIPLLVPDAHSGQLDTTRILQTAELYRLASMIYLHTTSLPLARSSAQFKSLVSRALRLLETFSVCTSPWPLFVTALEVDNDADRVRILRVLETMQRIRRIGNVDVLQGVVAAVWKLMDLRGVNGGDGDERSDWRELFDISGRLPSFI